ncbi:hypothetical protein OLX02_03225 [Novosphingobium sp. KCTC 2891]|uniref:hypothetical protein n=1 Tax=Novosphingobium sp. KCTC 2891 TaxID=2989730 RepID=UPI002221A19B|nr:hypothetical protein [Novosphingobium sp. KCTC 2891]MCW1381827.1 hypothetical protein [Novosphingobium sp. KCTC 2891]
MRCVLPLVIFALAACSQQTPAEKAAADARAIAEVNAAQDVKPPAKPIAPQAIGFFDITQNKLSASGCNFVADGGGMGAVLLAQAERAVMKVGDKLVILAADKGSAALPQGAWSRYSGREYALTLTRIEGGKASKAGVVEMFDAKVTVTDPHDQVVYDARGQAQCKPM